MNIGIDVDGVLTDMTDYQLRLGAPYFKKKYGYEVLNPDAYDVRDMFGCTDEERKKFGWRTIWTYILRYPAREGASEVIRKLKSEGHRIYIITGRVFVTQRGFIGWLSRSILTNWLKRHKIPYDGIFYCDEHHSARDKLAGCEKHRVDVMVEDKAENVRALSKVMRVICFDCGYNQECEGGNIVRVRDWGEVERAIAGLAR